MNERFLFFQEWSDSLATNAQTFADMCTLGHNPARSSVNDFDYVYDNIAVQDSSK